MPKADPSRQAKLFSFATGRPIDDPPEILEALDLLSQIAGRAMETGADPSALVSPDHHLLLCCDTLVMLHRQYTQLQDRWLALPLMSPERDRLFAESKRPKSAIYKLLLRISKLQATTASGIFAKAGAVTRSGYAAVGLGQSLARDLLTSPELRRAVWPAADRE